jgi:hypothetical protein
MKFTGVKLVGLNLMPKDVDYDILIDYAISQSIPIPNAQQRGRDIRGIKYAKAQGIWTEADVWYKFRSNGSYHVDFACLNWKNPGTHTLQRFNSPTFDADGFTGNGTDMYLDSGWIANTHGVKYLLNNAGFIISLTVPVTSAADFGYFGIQNSVSPFSGLRISISNGVASSRVNRGNSGTAGSHSFSGFQSFIGSRISSGGQRLHKGGSLIFSDSVSSNSRPTISAFLLARNFDGTASNFTTETVGNLILGSSFNSIDYNLIENYQTTYVH